MSDKEVVTRRKFARIFETAEFGDVLVTADTDDDGDPCLRITADTHPGTLNPTSIVMSFDEDSCQFEKLSEITQEKAEGVAKVIHSQAAMFTGTDGS